MSQQASSVVELLEYEAIRLGVKFYLNCKVDKLEYKNKKFIINNDKFYNQVIISTGSVAMPKLGSSKCGYDFAKNFGHNIIEPFASLVQLISSNKNLEMITGVKIEGLVNKKYGDILFTKYGLSGSVILEISRDISLKLNNQKEIKIFIDTMPNTTKEQLIDMFNNIINKKIDKDIVMYLNGFMNKKLAKYIVINSKLATNIKYIKFLSKKDIVSLVNTIKNLEFTIIGTKGFDTCEVCAGGVDTTKIDSKTMESKLQNNLYFTGEVLDVDGDCGGYNLHWAWASGFLASSDIIKKRKVV